MKISFKILISGLIALLIVFIFIMAYLYKNEDLPSYSHNKYAVYGNGIKQIRTVTVKPFKELIVQKGINLYIEQGNKYDMRIEADSNIIDCIKIENNDDFLKIETNCNIKKSEWFKIYLTIQEIERMTSTAGSIITTKGIMSGDTLSINASAGSILNLNLNFKKFIVQADAGVILNFDGNVDYSDFYISSGSVLNAKNLNSNNTKIIASSGAVASFGNIGFFDIDASSGAVISYKSGKANFLKVDEGAILKNQ